MKFNETISKYGYKIINRDKNTVLINKEYNVANIYIAFHTDSKQLTGCIRTNSLIYTLDQIATHYAIFREMQRDLKTFQQLSNYVIID